MAKLSVLMRNKKREKMVAKFATQHAQLKKQANYQALDKLPKNASPVRLRNRCWQCGRARAFLRVFGLCRICFRTLASQGRIPGMHKASW